jgi:hypothetical protein
VELLVLAKRADGLRVGAGGPLRIGSVGSVQDGLFQGCLNRHGALPLRLQLLTVREIDY